MIFHRLAAGAIIIVTVAILPRNVDAQGQFVMPGQEKEEINREFIIQVGLGTTVPLLQLGAQKELDDGFATPNSTIIIRAYFPYTSKIDFMFDLSLPKFKVDHEEFLNQNTDRIDDAFYKGKVLSLGARWFALSSLTEKGFLMASAGMYQLVWDRFLNGMRSRDTIILGGFKPGFSVGCGIQFEFGPIPMDGVLRFHSYLDNRAFGEGGLGWLELSFQAAVGGSR